MLHRVFLLSIAAATVATMSAPVQAQKVVAVGDEWLLSDTAFTNNTVNTTNFALNIASEFDEGNPAASFLAYSSNFGLTGGSLAAAMTGAGYSWTVSTAQPFTLATLNTYQGVFLGGTPGSGGANAAVLAAYVNGGGNVFVMAGTGEFGSAPGEASAWDPFLNTFGLGFGSTWFESASVVPITVVPSANPLQSGVSTVTWGFGQSAFETNPANTLTDTAITGQFSTNQPIVSTFGIGSVSVPESGTVALLMGGALPLAIALVRRRRML
ncbi:MAG: PEP-CTERM sorting domain-containing protein [Fibrella sp.]|nr:PEP-CTERM sorting domain-containing protein [Armatimonadota bacterium]